MTNQKSDYSKKLLDPRWQKKRLEILDRDKWTCQICEDTKNTLHVHHKVYESGKEPWDIDSKHLVTLCADCHESETKELAEYSELFIETFKRSDFFADDLRELALGINQIKLLHLPGVVASAYSFAFKNPEMQRLILEKYFDSITGDKDNLPF